jgi:glycerol-3-phosphate dehydrogenase
MAFLDVGVALKALPRVIDIMAEELNWTEARKQLEWTQTVHFFKSMGLPEEKLNVTKEEVLSSIVQDIPPHHQPSPIRSEGGAQVGGLGSFDGTIAARNITPN